ncbi:MAG TPA: sugar transferase [Acetobacteraceae bacterium]|nr:sugar transferase [Acetobacteraceae bacterium]
MSHMGRSLGHRPPAQAWWRAAAVRVLDLSIAVSGLLCLGTIMGLVALSILLEDGRPVIYTQARIGRYGYAFRLYKFRKFRVADGTGPRLTVKDDPRLTRVGRLIERTKLDELPQLWNVLIGSMSIVGPRPEVPEFADCFDRECQRLLDFKPGIFGPAQVAFRREGELYPDHDIEFFYREVLFPEKARLDLAYYPNRSVSGDIVWIWRGVGAVLDLAAPATVPPRGAAFAALGAAIGGPSDQSLDLQEKG